jgi:DNA-directed RNA polymerase III subunit RPC1
MGKHGIKVDHRHIMLLADTMSFRGQILRITRFGIGKMRTSTLISASFEQTADYLFNAAVESVHESVKGSQSQLFWVSPFL